MYRYSTVDCVIPGLGTSHSEGIFGSNVGIVKE